MSNLTRSTEFLQFEAANRSFCLDVDQVLGVISLPSHMKEAPTLVPFKGDTIPVFSLESILDMEERVRFAPPEVIAIRCDSVRFGISVDWVGEIHKILLNRAVFRLPSSTATRVKMFGVWGMAKLGSKLALILEPSCLLQKVRISETAAHFPQTTRPRASRSSLSHQ